MLAMYLANVLAEANTVMLEPYLANVLAEGRVGDHLAQEVEVGRHQSHDATANHHGHVLLIGQSHVLQEPITSQL